MKNLTKCMTTFILILPQILMAHEGDTFRHEISREAQQVRRHLEKSEKDLEQKLTEGFHSNPSHGQRIQAAIYLGTLYHDKQPELASSYMEAAFNLRDSFSQSSIQSIGTRVKAKTEREEQKEFIVLTLQKLLSSEARIPWRMKKQAYESILSYYQNIGDNAGFRSSFREYFQSLPDFVLDTQLTRSAAVLEANYQSPEAKNYYKALLEIIGSWFPLKESSKWAIAQLENLNVKGEYNFSLKYLRKLYMNGGLEQSSLDTLRRLVQGNVYSDSHKTVIQLDRQDRIRFFSRARQYPEAMAVAQEALNLDETSEDKWLAEQWLAFINGRMGQHHSAIALYDELLLEHGEPGLFFLENYAENLMKSQRHALAASTYKKVLEKRNNYRLRWYSFWNSFQAKMDADALAFLNDDKKIFSRYYYNRNAIPYWKGKIQMRQGNALSAMDRYQNIVEEDNYGYYATLIRLKYKNMPVAPQKLATISDPALHDLAGSRQESDDFALEGNIPVNQYMLGDDDLSISPKMPTGLAFAVSSSAAILPEQPNRERMLKSYPQIYQDHVETIAAQFKIDPLLLYSLMRAESAFNPNAVSHVGARGIMQMMPYTAVKLSQYLGDEDFSLDELNTPLHSIYYGAAYIKILLEKYQNNPFVAIAAYNAGPQSVDRWLSECRHCQVDDFVELIPFKETRLYVKKVVKNYSTYKGLYQDSEILDSLPSLPKNPRQDLPSF